MMCTIKLKVIRQCEVEKNSMYEEDFHTTFNSQQLSGVPFSVPIQKSSQEHLDLDIFQNNDIEKSLSYTRLLTD